MDMGDFQVCLVVTALELASAPHIDAQIHEHGTPKILSQKAKDTPHMNPTKIPTPTNKRPNFQHTIPKKHPLT
jgi:hypothetical protein